MEQNAHKFRIRLNLFDAIVLIVVLLCLRSAWHKYSWNKALISVIVWGSLASIYVSLRVFLDANVWKVFLLGIPGQVAISLWFRMFQSKEERSEETDGE